MPCTGRGFLLPSRCPREGVGRCPHFADAETETQGGTALPKVTRLEAAEPGPQPLTCNKVASSCLGPSPGQLCVLPGDQLRPTSLSQWASVRSGPHCSPSLWKAHPHPLPLWKGRAGAEGGIQRVRGAPYWPFRPCALKPTPVHLGTGNRGLGSGTACPAASGPPA